MSNIVQTWIDYLDCTGHDLTPLILGCAAAIICLIIVFILLLTEKSGKASVKAEHEVLDYQQIMGNASNSWEQEPVPYTDPNQYADPNLYTTPNAYADSNTYENYDSGEEPTSYGNYDGGEAPTSYGNYDSGEAPTSYREPEAMENPTQAPYGSDQMPVYMENRDGETMLLNETDNNGTVFLPEEEGRVITLTEQADRFKEFQLRLAPSATIGRVTDRNTLAFPDEKSISAVHCRVYT